MNLGFVIDLLRQNDDQPFCKAEVKKERLLSVIIGECQVGRPLETAVRPFFQRPGVGEMPISILRK